MKKNITASKYNMTIKPHVFMHIPRLIKKYILITNPPKIKGE